MDDLLTMIDKQGNIYLLATIHKGTSEEYTAYFLVTLTQALDALANLA